MGGWQSGSIHHPEAHTEVFLIIEPNQQDNTDILDRDS